MANYMDLLPIGSVVLLKGGNRRVMICGRVQANAEKNVIYDYSACLFPQGIIDSNDMYFFNHDDIQTIFFIGCQDVEELAFRNEVLGNLGELEIRDGQIVPKEN